MNFTKGSPRRELQEETNGSPAIFKAPSPVKTPNGRAGLPSPKRRGIFDLDKSARKRAFKSTSAYSQLMNDGTDDFDYLEEQDRELAGRIIRESKRAKVNDKDEESEEGSEEYIRAYGSDVELEEDLTEKPKTRRRTQAEKKKDVQPKPRPRSRRRATVDEAKSEDEDESDEAENIDDEEDSDVDVDDDEDVEDEEHEEEEETEEDEQDDIEEEEELQASPTRSRRRQRNDIEVDEEISPRKVGRPRTREIKEKRRVGRPSKADKVISQVKSIFQMDDDAFFQENKSPKKKDLLKSPQKRANVPLVNFNNTGDSKYSKIPVVSGITQENEAKKDNVPFEENDFQTRFTPMPIPELDENGEIIDKEYVEKYFPRSNLELKFKGKLADERAFFLEGSEGYFEQHNTRVKASAGSLSQSAPHIEYDEFLPYVKLSELVRKQERANIFTSRSIFAVAK
ncbi:hypothetical protein QCA50_016236 [Cerrena zonata]|uniref:Uncharacterized protein n=1 Tax=Cerrena zonata TaxID=2478898 RepID=A0AAW0FHS9_9APHY